MKLPSLHQPTLTDEKLFFVELRARGRRVALCSVVFCARACHEIYLMLFVRVFVWVRVSAFLSVVVGDSRGCEMAAVKVVAKQNQFLIFRRRYHRRRFYFVSVILIVVVCVCFFVHLARGVVTHHTRRWSTTLLSPLTLFSFRVINRAVLSFSLSFDELQVYSSVKTRVIVFEFVEKKVQYLWCVL